MRDGMMLPTVSVRVESMQYAIRAALTEREMELQRIVDEAVDAAIRNDSIVKEVEASIEWEIKNAAREAVKSAVSALFWKEGARQGIAKAVRVAMRDALSTDEQP